jgi:hypothetical protein
MRDYGRLRTSNNKRALRYTLGQGVCRLAAGGKRIRTPGPTRGCGSLWATLDEQLLGFPIEPFAGTLADDHHREGQGHHSVVFAEKVPDRLANKNPIRIKPGESADAIADRIVGVMPGLKGGAFSA